MPTVPEGYREVPEEDRKKANSFFGYARNACNTGNFDYAIELFLDGLKLDPDAIAAHQELRDLSFKRKAGGGKPLGFMAAMQLKRSSRDDKQNMLNAEKLLAYDPGNTDHMQSILTNAQRAGYFDTALWIGPLMLRAVADEKKPDINKFLTLMTVYKALEHWRLATEACNYAVKMRPDDMDLQTELKNLGAMHTMKEGNYGEAGSFRDSVRDQDKQHLLLLSDKDTQDMSAHNMLIAEAEKEAKAEPEDHGKAIKLVDALAATESADYENRAVEILEKWFVKTKAFRYRLRIGQIHMKQMTRMARSRRAALAKNPADPALLKDWEEFKKDQNEFELAEFKLAAEAYPTDLSYRFEMAKRMFSLGQFSESIPIFQQARADPKYRYDAGILLARAFGAQFVDEADDTLANLIKDYQLQGDNKSKEMFYWRGRALELKGLRAEAIQHLSKVAQWDFNYRDVQARMKKLRGQPAEPTP